MAKFFLFHLLYCLFNCAFKFDKIIIKIYFLLKIDALNLWKIIVLCSLECFNFYQKFVILTILRNFLSYLANSLSTVKNNFFDMVFEMNRCSYEIDLLIWFKDLIDNIKIINLFFWKIFCLKEPYRFSIEIVPPFLSYKNNKKCDKNGII